MILWLILATSALFGVGRFFFGVMPARLNDPFVWYVTLAHFWVGALLWTTACSRFTKRERLWAFACLVLLIVVEVGYVFVLGMQEFNPPKGG